MEGTILYYLKGFGTPFLLLPAFWLVSAIRRSELAYPTWQIGFGGATIFIYSLSLSADWATVNIFLQYPVIVAIIVSWLIGFYLVSFCGVFNIRDLKPRVEDSPFFANFTTAPARNPEERAGFDYFRKTYYIYLVPQAIVYIILLLFMSAFIFFLGLRPIMYLSSITVGCLAFAAFIIFLFDRNRPEDIRKYFVKKSLADRKLKKRTTLLIAGVLIALGTIFEIPRGMWLAWLAHVFFIVVWLLIHFRYWRSVYE